MKSRSRSLVVGWLGGLVVCTGLATAAQGAFEGREISRAPDMCNVDMVDTVSWFAEESVRLSVEPWRCGKRVEIPEGATAAWVVCDEGGTNWIVRYDAAPSSNRCAFALAAGEGALPSEHDYTGYVSLLRGTNILGVLDRHEVRVMGQAADGGGELSPEGGAWGSLLQRMAEAEADIAGIAGDLAHQAQDIAAMEEQMSGLEAATNALDAAVGAVDSRIDSLWGECVGGFRWPDYFTVEGVQAGVLPGTLTNELSGTETVYNVVIATGTVSRLKGWQIDTEVYRQSDWEAEIEWTPVWGKRGGLDKTGNPVLIPSIDPDDLTVDGQTISFAPGVEAASSSFAAVRGTLGDYTVELEMDFDPLKQATTSTYRRFLGPAPGSLLEAGWQTVLVAASNGVAQGKTVHLRTWPEGYGSGTNHVPAGWNTNFWAAGLGDFSCISYHTDYDRWGPGGVYQPVTMVTPRHGIVANHFKPTQGSNVWFVSRSGEVLTNRVAAYRHVRGDLTVARLERAFDTNDIAPAELLGAGWHSFLYGSTNSASGLRGVPVVAYDCAERGYVMRWTPNALVRGRVGGVTDDASFPLAPDVGPFGRDKAVGGDSGSPAFWPVDGHTVLLGCFLSPGGGPLPTKEEVDEAIAAWGDEERCTAYNLADGGWPNPDAPPPAN